MERTVLALGSNEGTFRNIKNLWELAKENLTTEEINNKLLFGTDNWGTTVWHWAAMRGHLETLQKLWEWAKENERTEEINYILLFGTDNEGWTVGHLAAMGDHLETLQNYGSGLKRI